MRQDMAFFDAHQSGEIINRLTSDVQEFKVSLSFHLRGGPSG
jgi:ABC-type multidrug transport system fused ATPase/permease subunit